MYVVHENQYGQAYCNIHYDTIIQISHAENGLFITQGWLQQVCMACCRDQHQNLTSRKQQMLGLVQVSYANLFGSRKLYQQCSEPQIPPGQVCLVGHHETWQQLHASKVFGTPCFAPIINLLTNHVSHADKSKCHIGRNKQWTA